MVRHIHIILTIRKIYFGDKKFSFGNFEEVYAIYTHILTPSESFHLGSLQIEAFENFDCLKRLKI